jgi:predicted GIY-YIG superfamily endonuclease
MLTFSVYMLKCADGSYYIGHTDNMEARLSAHQQGKGGLYTSKRLPVALVYVDTCGSRAEALNNEHRMKKWSRAKKEALSQGNFERLRDLSKKKFEKKKKE